MENMRPTMPASLGITTQVCEMSLDLDVDLLVTEECPVTSLIQRMGRCNREREARPLTESGEVIVYSPVDSAPYSEEDLTRLAGIPETCPRKGPVTNGARTIAGCRGGPAVGGDKLSMFLESGPYASPGGDIPRERGPQPRVRAFRGRLRLFAGWAGEKAGILLPVPKRWAKARDQEAIPEHRRLPRYLGVAAAGHYHTMLGYCDRPLDEWRTT